MKTTVKIFAVLFTLVLTLGIFFTPKTYADDTKGARSEIVFENGNWVKYIYNSDGGIVEVIIIAND
jgi:hypothetical protein